MGTPVVLVHCLLTLLFVAVLLQGPARGVGSPGTGFGVRVDRLLAAVMAVSMAAMPWIDLRAGHAAVAGDVFTAGSVWFLLPLGGRGAARTATMTRRLPHAAGMAAMAWMLRVPHTGTGPAHAHLGSAAHSTGPGVLGDGAALGGSVITLSLASCLLAYALWSLTRPMPSLRSAVSAARRAAAAMPSRHVGDGAMALGTAVMLVLPH
ncbi:DUF5134 domain-containing protein [Streptomyces sp. NPDC101209]|uniref:DUF5134 domain-containing protein n=1 Tax=Streptomyces sp. NPDC101209 TaxID=3366129 RepID=UPI00381E2A6D